MISTLFLKSQTPYPASRISYSVSRIPHPVSFHLAALLVFLALPVQAQAHLVNTGLGPFYDGVSHLFIAPEDLLTVLALGMLAGLGGPRYGRVALFGLTGAWIAGGIVGLAQATEFTWQLGVMLPLLVVGALVAVDRPLPVGVVVSLAVVLGLLHGFLNGTAMTAARLGWIGLMGVGFAVFVVTALIAAFVVWLQPAWARIGVRVAGSWIAAVGILMVGWAMRGR